MPRQKNLIGRDVFPNGLDAAGPSDDDALGNGVVPQPEMDSRIAGRGIAVVDDHVTPACLPSNGHENFGPNGVAFAVGSRQRTINQ